jgi:A/G-specific adenine glycosylase
MIGAEKQKAFASRLLDWYGKNARALPWRKDRDPYRIWVSEIMLQQTRVESVIPYFQRWMELFPTLEDLAGADEDRVLSAWEGLGYYQRALNLQRAAREVRNNYGGKLPEDAAELGKLPGIGRYTAGAISSIAFNRPAPVLDGNVRRVLARHFKVKQPLESPQVEKTLWEIAGMLVPADRPGDYNQALMELGALVCLPRSPNCAACPLSVNCQAHQLGIEDQLPIRKKTQPLPHLQVAAAVFFKDGKTLLAKRPPGGLLGGMWEYPGGKQESGESLEQALQREIREELQSEIEVGQILGVFHHAYTHYKVSVTAFFCSLAGSQPLPHYHSDLAWVSLELLEEYPMGKVDRRISRRLVSLPTGE